MKTSTKRFLFWTPRIICILFACFISIFALDVFGENHGFWNIFLALLIHLIPTGLLLLILAVAWRWEWVGALFFSALGVLYFIAFWGRFHWSVYAIIAGPLFLLGGLFLVGWIKREVVRAKT